MQSFGKYSKMMFTFSHIVVLCMRTLSQAYGCVRFNRLDRFNLALNFWLSMALTNAHAKYFHDIFVMHGILWYNSCLFL